MRDWLEDNWGLVLLIVGMTLAFSAAVVSGRREAESNRARCERWLGRAPTFADTLSLLQVRGVCR